MTNNNTPKKKKPNTATTDPTKLVRNWAKENYDFRIDKTSGEPIYKKKGAAYWRSLNTERAKSRIPHEYGEELDFSQNEKINKNLLADAQLENEVEVTRKAYRVNDKIILTRIGNKVMRITPDGVTEYNGDISEAVFFEPDDSLGDVDMDGTMQDVIDYLDFLNIADKQKSIIISFWCCALLKLTTPIILVKALPGSGKTVAADGIIGLFDSSAIGRPISLSSQDFPLIFSNNRAVHIDNVSKIVSSMSDLLCSTVTGGRSAKRKHYENEKLHDADLTVPIIMSTRNLNIKLESDLLSRLTRVIPAELSKSKRRDTNEMAHETKGRLPRVRGGVLKIAQQVLGYTGEKFVDGSRLSSFVSIIDMVENIIPELSGGVYYHKGLAGSTDVDSTPEFIKVLLQHADELNEGYAKYDTGGYRWRAGELVKFADEKSVEDTGSEIIDKTSTRTVRKVLNDNVKLLNKNGLSYSESEKSGRVAFIFHYNKNKTVE